MKLNRKLTTGQLQDYFDGYRDLSEEYEGKNDPFYAAAKVLIPAIEAGWYEDVPKDGAKELVRELDPLELWPLVEKVNELYEKYSPPAGPDPNS